jgi:hypothetical protein
MKPAEHRESPAVLWRRAIDDVTQVAMRLDDGELVKQLAVVRSLATQLLEERAHKEKELCCCIRTLALLGLIREAKPTDPRWPLRLLEQQRAEWDLPPWGPVT